MIGHGVLPSKNSVKKFEDTIKIDLQPFLALKPFRSACFVCYSAQWRWCRVVQRMASVSPSAPIPLSFLLLPAQGRMACEERCGPDGTSLQVVARMGRLLILLRCGPDGTSLAGWHLRLNLAGWHPRQILAGRQTNMNAISMPKGQGSRKFPIFPLEKGLDSRRVQVPKRQDSR